MSERLSTEGTPLSRLPSARSRQVAEEFDAAWRAALRSGAVPGLVDYLVRVGDSERPALRAALEEIERTHRPNLTTTAEDAGGGDTIELDAGAAPRHRDWNDSGSTVELPPEREAAPSALADTDPSSQTVALDEAALAASDATMPPTAAAELSDATLPPTPDLAPDAPMPPSSTGHLLMTVDPEEGRHIGATVDLGAGVPFDSTVDRAREQDFSLVEEVRRQVRADGQSVPGYEILGELGRGGMGVVYKARQIGLKRIVALKMVLSGAHASPDQLARFNIEAEAIAKIQHPNIVQIFDVGEHDGLPYFSLEFCDGGSLSSKLAGKPLPPREAAELLELLSTAMACAHGHNIIHRDLKPANILLNSDGLPKITDFGLAKKLEGDSSQTKSGQLMGTPSYMAPEQARGDTHEIGPLADVYSLGAILYECLTGRPPFLGAHVLDTLHMVRNQEPVPPTQLQPNLPIDLETICLKCLQKEPAKRYQSAEELAGDLHRYLQGEPILARPVGHVERLWRWCRRNPKLAALTSAVVLLLVGSAVGSTIAAVTIAQKKAEVEEQKEYAVAAQQAAVVAKNEAEANARVANDQADLALDSLSLLINQVQRELNKGPGQQKLRRALLETALGGLKKVANRKNTQTKMERNSLDAYRLAASISRELGNTEEAAGYLEQAHAVARHLLAGASEQDPSLDRLRDLLAWVCLDLGVLSYEHNRDAKKALEYYQECLDIRQSIANRLSDTERQQLNATLKPEDRLQPYFNKLKVSEAWTRLALVHFFEGDSAQAEAPLLKAVPMREALLRETLAGEAAFTLGTLPLSGTPLGVLGSMPYQRDFASDTAQNLARNYHLLGEIYYRLRNREKARDYYARTAAIREEAFRQHPDDFRLKGDMAQFYEYIGHVVLRLGDPKGAVPYYDRAIQFNREVVAVDKNVEYQQHLAGALYSRGQAALRLNEPKEADRYFKECLSLRDPLAQKDPTNDVKQTELLLILPHCGQHEQAAQLAAARLAHKKTDRELLLNAARCYAQCAAAVASDSAQRTGYEQKALTAVRDAVTNGYKDLLTLETEPDLDPLRTLPEFGQIVDQVKNKTVAANSPRP